MCLRIEVSNKLVPNALEIYIYVITAGISDGPSTQHKGPRGHIQCILVGRTKASQECGQILVKHALLFKKVPLTTPPKKRLRARNYLPANMAS